MPPKNSNLKDNIRTFISKEGELLKEPSDPTVQFVFVFSFPKGRDPKTGKPTRPIFQIIKQKKTPTLQINSRMAFEDSDIDEFKGKNKLEDFKEKIRLICLSRDIDYEYISAGADRFKDKKESCIIFDKLNLPLTQYDFWKGIRHLYFTGLLIAEVFKSFKQGKSSGNGDYSSSSGLYI